MFKRVFFAVAVMATFSAPVQATIVLSTVTNITGDTTSKTVTISLNTVSLAPPTSALPVPIDNTNSERVGFYNFRVDLSGVGITGLTASNSAGIWSALPGVAPGPAIVGNQVTFKGGAGANIVLPESGANTLGTISFTTTVNGNYNLSIVALDTGVGGGLASQNTGVGIATGFARHAENNLGDPIIIANDKSITPTPTIVVTGITAVPEPSSILLIGVAVAGLGGVRFRKRLLGKPH
jgi:hypothetical protein